MAYQTTPPCCIRIQNFSNPAVNFNGFPTGVSQASSESADAAASLNNVRMTVANWRASVSGLTITSLTANEASPQPLGSTTTFTVTSSGGTAPIQYAWWVNNGAGWTLAKNWSTSNTFSWTPSAAGTYGIAVWARSANNPANTPENNAARSLNFTITGAAGAQVRAFNDLFFCNPDCVSFTGRLTASEGYIWTALSGTYSPYQLVTSPTLSNFVAEAIGYGLVGSFSGTFNILSGRRYVLVITWDGANNPVLLLFDKASVDLSEGQALASSGAIHPPRTDMSAGHFPSAVRSSAGR